MFSERIFFIIERISDILNIDRERKEILTLCNELSDDERLTFLDLYSDDKKKKILERYSDDRIRRIMRLYSDDEKKEILKSYLDDRIRRIMKWYSDDEKMEILKSYSDDRIRRIMEWYSKDEKNQILKLYSDEVMKEIRRLYSDDEIHKFLRMRKGGRIHKILKRDPDNAMLKILVLYRKYENIRKLGWYDPCVERHDFLNLYFPDGDKEEFLEMYRELSDDDKDQFLDKYNYTWKKNILKYLEFRQIWFQKYYEGTFFQIINFLVGYEERKEVVLSIDVKKGIGELKKELLRIYNYFKDVEEKYDDRQVLSEYEQQLYLNLSYLAHSSDHILDRVTSNDVVASHIYDLVKRIQNSYNSLSFQPIYNFNTGGNTNLIGGIQIIEPTYIYLNHSRPSVMKNDSRPKSFGHVPNRHLVGFICEIQMLLNHLIQPQDETRVVGIVGAGGSGKTALAKLIYHHPQINTHFTRKIWVCISQSWDKTSILKLMWRQVAENPNAIEMEYDRVVYELSKLLSSHSYLVILDDIWSVDAWYDISPALLPCSGSKVMVTTRNKFLPQRIDPSVLIVEPKQLNDEESYELFKRGAFLPNESIPHHLLPLGMKMVKKCKGLPLAIIALAGVLRMDKSQSSWERLTHKMLNMSNESTQGVVKEILALSFYELPHSLKPCVLYLRVFPEDYVIEAKQLIQMWTAECFIDEEYVAEEYVDELAQRCIVEVVETNYEGQVHRFRIHDLIRQMFVDMNQERGLLKDSLRLVPSTTTERNKLNNLRPSPAWPTQVMVSTGRSGSLCSDGNTNSCGSTSNGNGNGKRACSPTDDPNNRPPSQQRLKLE